MNQYFGDTDIQYYNIFNNIALIVFFLYNIATINKKLAFSSKLSGVYYNYISDKRVPSILKNKYLIAVIEIIFIFGAYIHSRPLTSFVGNYIGTGANYYGILYFAPLIMMGLFLILSVNPFKQMDLIAPAFPLALFFIKLACLYQGCCVGFEWEHGVYSHEIDKMIFPTQLVEAILALLIFIFLLCIRKKAKEGTLYPIYAIAYSATRFISEFTRYEDNTFLIFKKYHFVCLVGVIIGVAQYIFIKNNKEKILRFYDKTCYILIDFFFVVIAGFGIKKEKNALGRKKKNRAVQNKRTQLSDVNFDFPKIRMWILIWTTGLIGQIGWNVEGTWLNTFVYDKIDKNPSIITPMLIAGAVAGTASIYVFGTLSDKSGKRRNFISWGYVIWGILMMLFATTQIMAKNYLSFTIVCVVIGDMLISFFGSMSTDVGYGTWLTDIMNDENRGQIGAAIAVQSVLGSLLGNIINSKLIGHSNNYTRLFIVIGCTLFVFGMLSTYAFNRADDVKIYQNKFKPQVKDNFTLMNLLKNKELLFIYITIAVFFTGFNTYFPHLGNYLIFHLGYSAEEMGIIEAIPLVLAMVVTIPVSKYINNNKFIEVSLIAVVAGLLGMSFMYPIIPDSINREMIFDSRLFLGIFLIGSSYVIMLQATKTWTKKLAPENSKGRFEVFFGIAFAIIPMIFGSTVGENIVKISGENILNEVTGRTEYIPNGNIFLIGVMISTLSILPVIFIKIFNKKRLAQEATV